MATSTKNEAVCTSSASRTCGKTTCFFPIEKCCGKRCCGRTALGFLGAAWCVRRTWINELRMRVLGAAPVSARGRAEVVRFRETCLSVPQSGHVDEISRVVLRRKRQWRKERSCLMAVCPVSEDLRGLGQSFGFRLRQWRLHGSLQPSNARCRARPRRR